MHSPNAVRSGADRQREMALRLFGAWIARWLPRA